MAEVDFSNYEEVKAWFENQSAEKRCAMSSRAALRVLANIRLVYADALEGIALATLRATLTSSIRGLGRTEEAANLETAARSALYAADSARRALFAAHSAARSAAIQAADSARYALSAADSASYAARSTVRSGESAAHSGEFPALSAADAALSAAGNDSENGASKVLQSPLWEGVAAPEAVAKGHILFLEWLGV